MVASASVTNFVLPQVTLPIWTPMPQRSVLNSKSINNMRQKVSKPLQHYASEVNFEPISKPAKFCASTNLSLRLNESESNENTGKNSSSIVAHEKLDPESTAFDNSLDNFKNDAAKKVDVTQEKIVLESSLCDSFLNKNRVGKGYVNEGSASCTPEEETVVLLDEETGAYHR